MKMGCLRIDRSTRVQTHIFPDTFGNYSHYVFSLMDVNDTGRINFQVSHKYRRYKIPMQPVLR